MPWTDDITRDGFRSAMARFQTTRGSADRVNGASLRSMFLAKMTPDPRRRTRDNSYFIRGQLQHYGVSFDADKVFSNGAALLKKALQEGKCDAVPAHIAALEEQLHREWLAKLPREELATDPDWVLGAYFVRLSDRQPDPTRTTTVVGIPFDKYSSYRTGRMREAADKVAGMHHETAHGPKTQTIFLGWDNAAERESKRADEHKDYLQTLRKKSGAAARKTKVSPVGSYIVDCGSIENEWPDSAGDLSIDINETDEPGVFEASFDFGVLEGVMILCQEQSLLERYCSEADGQFDDHLGEEDWDERDEDDLDEHGLNEEDESPKAGATRKASTVQPSGRGKKAKARRRPSHTYLVKLRCRDTGEGQIYPEPSDGTIRIKDENLAAFEGTADLPCAERGTSFTARKVSDESSQGASWADYSKQQAERACVSRWH
ncbi:hypothetical protein BDW74DRAFT_178473 [Aspergillus multicolor]|uniref:uncharacterized protein n=1 Tax=Aspergillus multicolor TaxID=41759 RepID=UPI003CCD3B1A